MRTRSPLQDTGCRVVATGRYPQRMSVRFIRVAVRSGWRKHRRLDGAKPLPGRPLPADAHTLTIEMHSASSRFERRYPHRCSPDRSAAGTRPRHVQYREHPRRNPRPVRPNAHPHHRDAQRFESLREPDIHIAPCFVHPIARAHRRDAQQCESARVSVIHIETPALVRSATHRRARNARRSDPIRAAEKRPGHGRHAADGSLSPMKCTAMRVHSRPGYPHRDDSFVTPDALRTRSNTGYPHAADTSPDRIPAHRIVRGTGYYIETSVSSR